MNDEIPTEYFCTKCGYIGSTDIHPGCNYLAMESSGSRITRLERELAEARVELAATIRQMQESSKTWEMAVEVLRDAFKARVEPLHAACEGSRFALRKLQSVRDQILSKTVTTDAFDSAMHLLNQALASREDSVNYQ